MREELSQYKGEKINDLIEIDRQIKELKEKRRTIMGEIRNEVVGIPLNKFPIPVFLYFDTREVKLVARTYGCGNMKVPTGNMTQDARLIFISGYRPSEFFGDDKEIIFYPQFHSISSDNKPGNSIYKEDMYNMEFEPLGDMTIDEARKTLKKVKKDIKKEKK